MNVAVPSSSNITRWPFPAKLQPLFAPHRYKVIHGGRGKGESWGVARALLITGLQKPTRVLCAREIQKSMADSVHQLLQDQITLLGLQAHYSVTKDEIRGTNGTLFTFAGLRHNIDNIKSKEGLDIVWVEEAQSVSRTSWEKLIPTIRKEGSEIWVGFNPELDTDETYVRFVKEPPPGACVIQMSWRDNPWFPEVLRAEKDYLKARDYDAYLTVWEGHCRATLSGAIFANEVRAAISEGRITKVPREPAKSVHTIWDLGRADMTSIWFVQQVGFEYRFIDFYEDNGHALEHYMKVLQDRGYIYGDIWLPHDATHQLLASQRTIEQQMRDAGYKVRVVPKMLIANQILAARTLFPNCYFDEVKCDAGLRALKSYQFKVDDDTGQRSKEPLHNWASHAASAFMGTAVALKAGGTNHGAKVGLPPPRSAPQMRDGPRTAWMGR